MSVTDGQIAVGDEVRFKGHTSDFTERIGWAKLQPVIPSEASEATQRLFQGAALDVLHRVPQEPGLGAKAVDWRDVRVVQGCSDPRFLLKPIGGRLLQRER